jgi:DNA-binding transcriptional LysR family regulator
MPPSSRPHASLTVRQLRYFVAVAEAKSFRRAADQLHVSQPPLTQQVKALEELLAVQLLDRSRRRVELTHAGATFLIDSRRILADIERSCAAARAAGRGMTGDLRVGVSEDVIHGPIFEHVMGFARSHAKIRLSTRCELSVTLIEQLRAEVLDVVVGNLPMTTDSTGIQHLSLPRSSIVALIPPEHPLADKESIEPADLQGQPLILPARDTCAWFNNVSDVMLEEAGVVPFVVHYTATTSLAVRLVAQSMGIALTSEHSIHPRTDVVRVVKIRAQRASLQHGLFWRERSVAPTVQQLIDSLRATCTD